MRAKETILTAEVVRQVLNYDPSTGYFTWRRRPASPYANLDTIEKWNRRHEGKRADRRYKMAGYRCVPLFNTDFSAHRLAWLFVHGAFPAEDTDHINGDPGDNRIANLRAVSTAENLRNAARTMTNSSGYTGISWHKRSKKWAAHIRVDGHLKYLGVFAHIDDAVAARGNANEQYGFHPNHGRLPTKKTS